MGNIGKRVAGKVEETAGTVQRGVGKLIGNEEMEARGTAHEIKGEAKQQIAKAGERVKAAGDTLVGKVKSAAGDLIGNEQLQAEGALREAKGKLRGNLNQ